MDGMSPWHKPSPIIAASRELSGARSGSINMRAGAVAQLRVLGQAGPINSGKLGAAICCRARRRPCRSARARASQLPQLDRRAYPRRDLAVWTRAAAAAVVPPGAADSDNTCGYANADADADDAGARGRRSL